MQSQLPVLIFAQSARFIAESATRAGYEVWVADCFCDLDTRAVAERWLQLPPFSTLSSDFLLSQLIQLSQAQPCLLICGTGIEKFYPVLDMLPPQIQLLGPSAETIRQLKQADAFFALLTSLNLHFPAVTDDISTIQSGDWLLKTSGGYGGSHIRPATAGKINAGDYYQQMIDGQSGSVTFISNGQQTRILSFNQQLNCHGSFQLAHILAPMALTFAQQHYLATAINKLSIASQLKGICSLDFIVDADGQIFILEVNPRLSASAELLPQAQQLFHWHITACLEQIPTDLPANTHRPVRMLSYLYAEQGIIIPQDMNWPQCCHDLPVPGTTVGQGEPICTIETVADDAEACMRNFEKISASIMLNLSPAA